MPSFDLLHCRPRDPLRDHLDEVTQILALYGVPLLEAAALVREAALEVTLRAHRTPRPADRLLRSITQRAKRLAQQRRQDAAEVLGRLRAQNPSSISSWSPHEI